MYTAKQSLPLQGRNISISPVNLIASTFTVFSNSNSQFEGQEI
jgi:hypothetical protein